MLDSEHENPELIWNEDTRKKVAKVVSEECGKLFQSQKQSSETLWSVPENFQLYPEDVSGEVVVSGVYLRLFVANPGWVLRRPKQFMEDLLENMLVSNAAILDYLLITSSWSGPDEWHRCSEADSGH